MVGSVTEIKANDAWASRIQCLSGECKMVKDFWGFCVKAFLGRYDEMKWDDIFHAAIFVALSSGLLYVLV